MQVIDIVSLDVVVHFGGFEVMSLLLLELWSSLRYLRRHLCHFKQDTCRACSLTLSLIQYTCVCVCIACNSLLPLMPPKIASRGLWSTCRHLTLRKQHAVHDRYQAQSCTRMFEIFTFNGHAAVSEQRIVVRQPVRTAAATCVANAGRCSSSRSQAVHSHTTTLAVPQRTYMSSRSGVSIKQCANVDTERSKNDSCEKF